MKINPSGKYNLNFIDWNNEYDAIISRDAHSYESPIYGMSDETYSKIMDEEFSNDDELKRNESVIGKLKTKLVTKD